MALYKHVSTEEVRDIADDLYAAWVAAGNPKATVWQTYTPPPPPDPLPPTPEEVWAQKLAGTITDPVTGIAIHASEDVRNILTGQLTMTLAALSAGVISTATPQDIWDASGVKHTLTTQDLMGLILRYGAQWQAMFAEFAP